MISSRDQKTWFIVASFISPVPLLALLTDLDLHQNQLLFFFVTSLIDDFSFSFDFFYFLQV
jgi:hypothetical protein